MQTLYIGIIILVIILLVFLSANRESFANIFYLDQMAMGYSDPMYFKYSSWERDVDGMSPRDYYLENQTNYSNQVAPGYFANDQLYRDHTGYLNMPPQYRPRIAETDMAPVSAAAPGLEASGDVGDSAEDEMLNNAAMEGTY
jgi:hypothetical protein